MHHELKFLNIDKSEVQGKLACSLLIPQSFAITLLISCR